MASDSEERVGVARKGSYEHRRRWRTAVRRALHYERERERELSITNEREERGGSGRSSGGRPGCWRGVAWPPHGGRGLPVCHGGIGAAIACGCGHGEAEGVHAVGPGQLRLVG